MAKSDLFEAIRKNSLRQLTLLIESGADVNSRNDNSETPLMVALYGLRNKEQREGAVKRFLQADADVNARNGQGRTALSFACALDQADSVRLLLEKEGVDANQGDISGVTPLMLSAALGHRSSVTTLMDFARSGRLRLQTQAKDDSDFTALDYAKASGNTSLAEQIRGKTKPGPAGKPGGNRLNNNNVKTINNNNKPRKAGEGSEEAEISPAALRDSNLFSIQKFGQEVKALFAQNDTNLTALSTGSRPGSRNTSSASVRGGRHSSQERPGSRISSRSKERPGSRVGPRARSNMASNEDDEDLDLDLSSLRDLMGTVREAAKEIREIVEPIQKEGREHAARSRENPRKKKKSRQGNRRNSGHQQKIQAEIHVVSEINGQQLPPAAVLPPPQEIDRKAPSAFLTVENEELSHTWPRQKGRSVSRGRERAVVQRTLSGSHALPSGSNSEGSTPAASFRLGQGAAEGEREILNKVVGRQQGGPDPLVAAINSAASTPKSRLIMESRQRIMGRARNHWAAHQPPAESPPSPQFLPHITVSEHTAQHHRDDEPSSPVDEGVDMSEGNGEPSSPAQPSPPALTPVPSPRPSAPPGEPDQGNASSSVSAAPQPSVNQGNKPQPASQARPTPRANQAKGVALAQGVKSSAPNNPAARPATQSIPKQGPASKPAAGMSKPSGPGGPGNKTGLTQQGTGSKAGRGVPGPQGRQIPASGPDSRQTPRAGPGGKPVGKPTPASKV